MPETTPAQELREAARRLREWAQDIPRPDFYFAVADWLDSEAEDYEVLGVSTQAFLAGDEGGNADHAVTVARAYLGKEGCYADTETQARKVAVEFHRAWLLGLDPGENDTYRTGKRSYDRRWMREHLADLVGRDLACWCGPEDVCHADTLIAIVNGWDEAGRVLMGLLHPLALAGRW